ncbi:RHS repeat-associated core domain-containing protein [Streptomyces sp. CMB-StM0423]|uniref:RHS repeat-associated core domain-containing protein n=1 Tax=Streptomyces sp. CMB-StM0423 TaxID=2059884 RepID=UPI000C70B2F4|nr:RHS repeat-associated core domain-containing protein [Streptomyces sp. CMB-StM0423]AUH39869.1 hypothetical protein CXR04_06065 [Streptomyces sp. CMB-StM0423]
MGNRPTDWYVLDLDDDPTPGDPERVKQLARELHDFADDVADALRQIKGMAGEDALLRWAGKTAKAFQDEFEEVPKNLKKLQRSYDLAGDALAAYWPKLERAQSLADKALARGREARSELSSATGRLDSANSWVDRATKKTEEYDEEEGKEKPDESEVRAATRNATDAKSAQSSAQTAVDNAESGLEAAKKMAADAKKMREDAASEAKDKLEEASDAGIQNRKWWEKAVDWVKDNWDTIVTVCKVIVAVLGIVVLIIGGPLAWVVLAAALVVLADTLMKYMNGEASLWDVAFAALDCIPGMRGLTTLGGLVKGVKGGLSMAKTGLKGMSLAVKGIAKAARSGARSMKKLFTCGDPIDMATGEMVMSAYDVSLPGILPLILDRHHRTGFASGRLFGLSWSSFIDQRLIADEYGYRLVTADGMVLRYPLPEPGTPVMPVEGPRWPLHPADHDGTFGVHRPDEDRTLYFRALTPGAGEARLVALTDRNGTTISVTYDTEGMPTEVVHNAGYRVAVTTALGHVVALHLIDGDSHHELRRFAYDERGDLAEVYNSSGLPQRFDYDDEHRIVGWADRIGASYRYEYDAAGRCVAASGAEGTLAYAYTYDDETGTTTATDSLGHTTRYLFDHAYQLVAETDPLGHTIRRTWDRYDRLTSITDPTHRTTRYAYDDVGNLVRATRPDGSAVTASYSATGLAETITLAGGRSWRQTFDVRGNRTSVVDPSGAATTYSYTPAGHPLRVTDPLGHCHDVVTDAAGLPVAVTDPSAATTRWERDAFGRIAAAVDALGARTELEWTTEGKPSRHRAPDGSEQRWTYDAEGNCTAHVDAAGNTVHYEYGVFDVLVSRTEPDGSRYEFTHDTELRLTGVTDPNRLTWTYAYDPAGRLVAETDFDQRRLDYAHDAAGRLVSRTNALGQEIAYRYDALGRVVSQNAAGAESTFAYSPDDELVAATGPDAELGWERDAVGRVTAETCNGRTLTTAYDARGRRTRRTTPAGTVTTYAYDATGRRTLLATGGIELGSAYDAAGHEIARSIGDALVLDRVWEPTGRLSGQTLTGHGRRLQEHGYHYRADGQLTGIDDLIDGPRTFELDPTGRVTAVTAAGWTESYAYDPAGNQTEAHWPAGPHDADATGSRAFAGTALVSAGAIRYRHDAAGRTVERQKVRLSRKPDTWRYEWDAEDRLTRVTTPDGVVWRYLYDPLGRRIAKHRLGGDGTSEERVEFCWDGFTLVEQTGYGPGEARPVTLTWDHDGVHPVAQSERLGSADLPQEEVDRRFFAIVTDLVGTPTELVDPDGGIAWRTRRTVWGCTAWSADATACTPLRFPGQYFDAESALHYNVHRYYDPETARYATPDPLGLTPAPNPGTYVRNPFTWSDPLGLSPCTSAGSRAALPPAGREPPNLEGTNIVSRLARPGEEFNMVLSRGQPPSRPGGFGTFDDIPNQQYAREQLAIRSDWKPDVSMVQRYRIPDGDAIRIQESIVGPQTDPVLGHLPGGGSQLEILNFDDRARLIPVGDPGELPT